MVLNHIFWITSFALILFYSMATIANKTNTDETNTNYDEDEIIIPNDPDFSDLQETYETVVVSQRSPLSAGYFIISTAEIEQTHPASASEILGLVPGVIIVQHGSEGKGHQLFLRGFDAAHGSDIEVLLQGISLNEPSHVHGQGYLDLYGIIPEVVGQVKVSKGPFLPWQGNFATAGSLRFELSVPQDLNAGLVRTEISHRGRLRSVIVVTPTPDVSKKHNSNETFLATEAVYDKGFGADRKAQRASLLGQYKLHINNESSLSAFISGQTAKFETPGALLLSDLQENKVEFHGAYGPAGLGLSDRIIGRLGFKQDNDNTKFELFVYGILRHFSLEENFTGWLQHEINGDRKQQLQNSKTAGLSLSINQKLPTRFSSAFIAGAAWRSDNLSQKEIQVTNNGTPWQTNRQTDANIHHANIYSGFRFTTLKKIHLFPSLRLDAVFYNVNNKLNNNLNDNLSNNLSDHKGNDAKLTLSPRLQASFAINKKVTIFADYGRGFRTPEARSIVAFSATTKDETVSQYSGGEPQVAICDTIETGVHFETKEKLSLKLVGFATWLEHEMVFDHVSNINLETNGTRRLGIEAIAVVKPKSWLSASADVTWVDARFNQSGNPIPGAPKWLTTARIFIGKKRGPHGGMQLWWLGKRQLAHGAMADGYVQLDVDAGWRFKHFEVSAIVDNALNYNIIEGAYHYASWFDKNETRSVIPKIHYVAGKPLTARLMLTVYL